MDNKEKNFVSAVIYVHNAEDRIGEFLRTIVSVLEECFEHSEIICVNDASDDDSLNVIRSISKTANKTSISVVNMSYFHGLELAMNAGVDIAIGDFVFEFDNTYLDYDTNVIMQVYSHSLEGYDIVSASPNRKERFTSRLFYRVFERFTDISYQMTTESFRVISRRAINRIGSMNKSIVYRKALYANCGLNTDNIKYSVNRSTSKLVDRKEREYRSGLAVDTLILFTNVGYKASIAMTLLMMAISLLVIAYTVIAYFLVDPVAGWTTTILFLSFSFFGLFGILTIIIKYLQLLVDAMYRRKHYSFESIEKLS